MNLIDDEELLARVEAFLSATGMPETRFGRDAMREASLVKRLREGRSLSLRNANKIVDFMADHAAANASATPDPSTRQTSNASTVSAEQLS